MESRHTVRVLFASALLAASANTGTVFAQTNTNARPPPPAAQVETIPVLQSGQVWAPGYWNWTGESYVWVSGRSIDERQAGQMAPNRADQRSTNTYSHPGSWDSENGIDAYGNRRSGSRHRP